MTILTLRDPFLATPFRLMDEIVRGWSGNRATGFTPYMDVRSRGPSAPPLARERVVRMTRGRGSLTSPRGT
jgi:hypothetical protein